MFISKPASQLTHHITSAVACSPDHPDARIHTGFLITALLATLSDRLSYDFVTCQQLPTDIAACSETTLRGAPRVTSSKVASVLRSTGCAAGVRLQKTLENAQLANVPTGLFFFLLFLLVIFAYAGWIGYTQYTARKAGRTPPTWKHYVPFVKSDQSATNYPTPRSSGPVEWIKDQISKLRNPRSARGAYEETGGTSAGGYAPAGARGRGRGFEDDAWDTRVGGAHDDPYEGAQGGYAANYEEQELGLAPTPGLHAEQYGGASDYTGARGRPGGDNPFADQHEAPSLRSVSPRPEADARGHRAQASVDSAGSGGDSPTGTRKSAFREEDMR
jgi:hypothetical protein